MAKKTIRQTDHVEYGSDEHKALLGLTSQLSEEQRAAAEAALKARPVVMSKKRPITPDNYAPTDRYGPGDEIIDSWTRVGR